MTVQEQRALLKTLVPMLKAGGLNAEIDPLDRPLLIIKNDDGTEWWLSANMVGLKARPSSKKPGEKPQIKNQAGKPEPGKLF